MSPGSSAPSALSAAIAGVSSTFATRRSSRSAAAARAQQQDSPPPPAGSDSCYGVRSLDGSVEWATSSTTVAAGNNSDNDASDVSEPSSSDDARDPVSATTTTTERVSSSPQPIPRAINITAAPTARPRLSAAPTTGTSPSSFGSDSTTTISRATTSRAGSYHHPLLSVDSAPIPRPSSVPPITSPRRTADDLHAEGTPTPPAMSPLPAPPASPTEQRRIRPMNVSVASHALFDMLADAPSEPSSPASLESACVASLSSLSRTSSATDWDWRPPMSRSVAALNLDSDTERRGLDALGLEAPRNTQPAADLVLPTLALPSTSLHLGLDRWNGPPSGTRIALLAGPERTRNVLGALAARRKCVQLPHGHVGVLEDGRLSATVLTGLTAADVRERASQSYAALHDLLNPSANADQRRSDLESIVAAYASRADWVHLVVPLDGASTDDLDGAVPVTTLRDEAERLAAEAAEAQRQSDALAEAAKASIMSPAPDASPRSDPGELEGPAVDDTPTHEAATEPWHCSLDKVAEEDEVAESTASLPPDADADATVALLERVISDGADVASASTAAFLEWRPSPLPVIPSRTPASSLTASSPASSTFEGAAPVPTVRSSAGSGEWEASLSRRLAHRRELDAAARRARAQPNVPHMRARRRRRGSPTSSSAVSPPHDPPSCGPLFPRRRVSTAGVGLADLFDRVFAPVRHVLTRTSWTQVVFACAVAIAVGCGFWAVRAA